MFPYPRSVFPSPRPSPPVLFLVNVRDLAPVRLLANDGDPVGVLGQDLLGLALPFVCGKKTTERRGQKGETKRKKGKHMRRVTCRWYSSFVVSPHECLLPFLT